MNVTLTLGSCSLPFRHRALINLIVVIFFLLFRCNKMWVCSCTVAWRGKGTNEIS